MRQDECTADSRQRLCMRLHGQRHCEVAEWHKEIRVPEEVICIHIGFFVAALVEVGSDNLTLLEG